MSSVSLYGGMATVVGGGTSICFPFRWGRIADRPVESTDDRRKRVPYMGAGGGDFRIPLPMESARRFDGAMGEGTDSIKRSWDRYDDAPTECQGERSTARTRDDDDDDGRADDGL